MSTSITYSDEFLTTTAKNRLEHLRTQQYRPYRVAEYIIQNAKKADGGERLLIPYDIQAHSATTQMTTGYEAVDLDVQTVMKPGHENWAFSVSPVVYSFIDEAKNAGKHKVIDLIEKRVKDTEMRMKKEFETQLLKGTVSAWSDWVTLNGSDNSTGIIEEDAVGSQANTVHNLSKSTYSSLVGFQNQRYDMAGDFSANGIIGLQDLHIRIREVSEDPTSLKGFCSIAGARNYNTAVQANERYINERDAVRTNILISGMEYSMSSLMPDDGTTTGAGNDEWSFLILDGEAVCMHALPGLLANMTPFRDIGGGHLVKACFLQYGGQIAVRDYKTLGLGYGGDTY